MPIFAEPGGAGGIRTLGTLLGYNGLANRPFRPLRHGSRSQFPSAPGRGACQGRGTLPA
ncbi:protein of unknown function [Methylacidimicrobium sp. AP8]|nr:protein of unknown function [Methylacidimicrobium sp. AP8]